MVVIFSLCFAEGSALGFSQRRAVNANRVALVTQPAEHGGYQLFVAQENVPLIVFGTGVQPGVRQERVTPPAIAAIVARALGVPPPEGARFPVPDGLFK